jgi:DNA-binding MarR family transcriptional regulator
VRRASQELDGAIASCLGEPSVGRWHVLDAIMDGSGRSMSQLADATRLNGASLTRLIDAMIAGNLVHRKVDDTDRRRVLVFPTRRGHVAHQGMTRAITESGLDLIANDSDRVVRSLTALIARLHDSEPARTQV